MLEAEKQTVIKIINDLWAHDSWLWGNTCESLINHEINFDAPAIIEVDGDCTTANVFVKDGREFQIGYQEGGWWMCFIKDNYDEHARLTKRVPDICPSCAGEKQVIGEDGTVWVCGICGGTGKRW